MLSIQSACCGSMLAGQLFVSWAVPYLGRLTKKQQPSCRIVEAIVSAYFQKGLQPPIHLYAHSMWGIAMYWAWFQGISIKDIYSLACWSLLHSFMWFYRFDVSKPTLEHSVLKISLAGNSGVIISHSEIYQNECLK